LTKKPHGTPIPWNIQRIFRLIVLLIFIICVASLLLGAPMVHFFGRAELASIITASMNRELIQFRAAFF
jgi:hypothetical protein